MTENKAEKRIKGMIEYPCCPKETVMVYETSHGRFSSKCPRCGKFVLFDTDEMKAEVCAPLKGAKDKFKREPAVYNISSQPCLMVAEKSEPYIIKQKIE